MTIGSILGETWSLYTKFFARFVLLALVVYLVVDFLAALLELAVGRDSTGASLLLAVVTAAVSVVGSFWLQGALVFAVQDVRDGSFDQSNKTIFDRVRPFLGTLIVAGILAGIGIAVGLVLLIVPGLVLLTWWALIGPAVVLEGKPVGAAFSRSRELVRGREEEPRARAADRMAERDRAAVDIQLLLVERTKRTRQAELVAAVGIILPRSDAAEHLRRERFVDLPRVEIVQAEAMPLQERRRRMHRAEAHLRRIECRPLRVDDAPDRRQAVPAYGLIGCEHKPRRAVGDLRAVAGRYVAELAVEERLQLRKRRDARIAPQAVIFFVHGAALVVERHDFAHPTVVVGARDALMANMLKVMADNHLDAIVHKTVEHQPTLIRDGVNPPFVNQKGAPHINTFLIYVPSITVPAGFTSDNLPTGITFLGRPYSDASVVNYAYAYEQASNVRQAPSFTNPSMWRCVPGSFFFLPHHCHPGDRLYEG